MQSSIDFLPERKQRDLYELVGLIRDEVKDVVMIILYGSYARNTYVELDIQRDYGGGKIQFMSDYDILVVTKRRLGSRESTVNSRIKDRFLRDKGEFQTYPQIINESISKFNNALSEGRYFYVDILAEGIMLYDSGECSPATPRELNFSEIKDMHWNIMKKIMMMPKLTSRISNWIIPIRIIYSALSICTKLRKNY